jgi:hypothetical protein
MKKLSLFAVGIIVFGSVMTGAAGCDRNEDSGSESGLSLLAIHNDGSTDFIVSNLELIFSKSAVATAQDVELLKHMKEEEKLARDVYMKLYEVWGVPIFANISRSEERHLAAVIYLLSVYSPADTVTRQPGQFEDDHFRELYDDLTEKGSESLAEAFRTGATIEDLDIKDLQDYLALTENENIIMVFENLLKGSRNHLRAFNRQLTMQGASYEPQFIDQPTFEEIINTPLEQGRRYRGGRNR